MSRTKFFSASALIGLSIVVFALFWATRIQAASNQPAEIQRIYGPIAVSQNQHAYNVYAVHPLSGKMMSAVRIDMATVETVGVPEETTLLAEASNPLTGAAIKVYRLNSGEFRVDTLDLHAETFSMTWDQSGNIFTDKQ